MILSRRPPPFVTQQHGTRRPVQYFSSAICTERDAGDEHWNRAEAKQNRRAPVASELSLNLDGGLLTSAVWQVQRDRPRSGAQGRARFCQIERHGHRLTKCLGARLNGSSSSLSTNPTQEQAFLGFCLACLHACKVVRSPELFHCGSALSFGIQHRPCKTSALTTTPAPAEDDLQ